MRLDMLPDLCMKLLFKPCTDMVVMPQQQALDVRGVNRRASVAL
jgi:hypothetical protein